MHIIYIAIDTKSQQTKLSSKCFMKNILSPSLQNLCRPTYKLTMKFVSEAYSVGGGGGGIQE